MLVRRYFEKAYALARAALASDATLSRKVVDTARVNLGMSKGNAALGSFLNIIKFDMSSLLTWKNSRSDFGDM